MKTLFLITLILLYSLQVIAQQSNKKLIRAIEKTISYPQSAQDQKLSCIALLKVQKRKGKSDTLILLNNVEESFRFEIVQGLKKLPSNTDYSSLQQDAILPLYFSLFNEDEKLGEEKLSFTASNIGEVLSIISKSKNRVIYEPILIIKSNRKR